MKNLILLSSLLLSLGVLAQETPSNTLNCVAKFTSKGKIRRNQHYPATIKDVQLLRSLGGTPTCNSETSRGVIRGAIVAKKLNKASTGGLYEIKGLKNTEFFKARSLSVGKASTVEQF